MNRHLVPFIKKEFSATFLVWTGFQCIMVRSRLVGVMSRVVPIPSHVAQYKVYHGNQICHQHHRKSHSENRYRSNVTEVSRGAMIWVLIKSPSSADILVYSLFHRKCNVHVYKCKRTWCSAKPWNIYDDFSRHSPCMNMKTEITHHKGFCAKLLGCFEDLLQKCCKYCQFF